MQNGSILRDDGFQFFFIALVAMALLFFSFKACLDWEGAQSRRSQVACQCE